MKKLLGISVIAMLAVAPAFADPVGTGTTPSNDASATIIETNPPFAEVAANSATDGNAASAGYVKGAYNAAIKAINKVNNKVNSELATTAGNGIAKNNGAFSVVAATDGGIAVSASGVSVDHGNTLEMTGDAGSKKLDVKVDGTTIEKSGTGALQVKSGVFDANGAASTAKSAVETKLQTTTANATDGYDIKAKTLSVGGDTAATLTATQTLTNKTINADNNTISNLEADNFKTGVVVDSTTGIAATSSASDDKLVTEKAVRSAVDTATTGMATQTGVNNTINALTYSTTLGTFQLTSGTVSGSVTVPIMNDWSNPNTASSVVVNGNNISLSVGTGITNGTATTTASIANYATANQPGA